MVFQAVEEHNSAGVALFGVDGVEGGLAGVDGVVG
jgi:hypothetical protein